MKRSLLAVFGLGVFAAGTAMAQDASQAASTQKTEDEVVKREEVVVVSASKVETKLINAPATVSVVEADTIAASPAQNYGDLLRSVPGLNVIQTSARDINITARQATSSLANSQLVLLDGRSIYLDFFGLVLWDFVPQNPTEIKQIEVVRGPASAVWGANALTGIINIITKTPREAEGFGLTLTGGLFGRGEGSRADEGNGVNYGASFSIAQAPNDKVSWRLSAGYFDSEPYSRPLGNAPRLCHPLDARCISPAATPQFTVGGGAYPADRAGLGTYVNQGTSQPKADFRLDRDFSDGARLTFQGGYAGTEGIIHTGIGPFNIQNGSRLFYPRLQYTRGALRLAAFGNFVDADAPNELARDASGQPVVLGFKTETYDFEIGHSAVVGGKHILSYGGNARRNNFDITLAPAGQDRSEFGVYFQEEFFLDRFRVAVGGRVDKFGNLEDPFFSPRVSLMFKPGPEHALRLSFNRAFRSPSLINNYLDQSILSPAPVDLRPLAAALPPPLRPLVPSAPFFLTVRNVGSEVRSAGGKLDAQSLNAYEFSYTGTVKGRTTLGFAVYQNDSEDDINFTVLTQLPVAQGLANGLTFYSATNPARGVTTTGQPITLSPTLMVILGQLPAPFGPILLPETVATYLNLGPLRQRGIEVSVEHSFTNEVNAFANYSWQGDPKILDENPGQIRFPELEISLPSRNRFNAGVSVNTKRFLGNASVNFTDEAFWTDVLAPDFSGRTDSFTMVNATFGVKWADGKVVTSVKGTNVLNETIQQQVYGDILKFGLVGEVRIFVK